MRQLLPEPSDAVDPAVVYADPPLVGPTGRPAVRLNMISSVDGGTTVDGLSGGLGSPGDHAVYAALRSLADAVLVAAGTARAEHYGPARLPDDVQEQRRARGQHPVPVIAVVSRNCVFDWAAPFFTEAVVRPVIVTVEAAEPDQRARAAEVADVVLAGDDLVDLGVAVAALGERGAGSVLAEGGPTLNGQLGAAGLLDELCLSLAPRLVGGASKRILGGTEPTSRDRLSLLSLLEDDGFLFLRYRVD